VSQNSNGAVFVALSTAPVLVRTNYTSARIYGFEYEFEAKVTDRLNLRGNYTFIHAADPVTGLPPNIEGGTPPPQGMVSLRYQMNSRIWLEAFSTLAGRQSRLSSLDLSDRRTGAVRSRLQIQNFFRRGACVLGLTNNPDGRCGTGDETILLLTNESVLQVQNRVLGLGNDNVPMFAYLPGFALVNLRGGIKLNEQSRIFWSLENALDQYNRKPSWGMDGSGRNLKLQYSVRF
jgi:hemoglobin/transferrin/lactoferrin receptor protein